MELPLKRKLFYFFPVLFCFCLPFGSLVLSGIIVAWTVTSFFNLDPAALKKGFANRTLHLFYLFFLATLISAIFSENRAEAVFSLEIKMTFIIFPYLLFCFQWPRDILKRCVVSFVSGCFFASLYLIGRAFIYYVNGDPAYFFYTMFSDFIHASSFAMYLLMAIVFVVVLYKKWFSLQKSVIYGSYFFIAVFSTAIFLCSSKIGLLSFFIILPLLVFYRVLPRRNTKQLALLAGGFIVLIFLAYLIFPASFERLQALKNLSVETVDKTSVESTGVRLLIWDQSIGIIKDHLITGTGVADANDELYAAYLRNGITGAYTHKLNAHNQFLQTFVGMGLIGFVLLLFLTFGTLIRGLVRKRILLCLFALLVILNFAVESMLQRSDGVLFFTFFFCFLNLVDEKELTDNVPIP